MPDEPMTEHGPLALRHEIHESQFNFNGIFLLRQPKPLREAGNVCVDDNAGIDVESISQNDVGRFSPDTAECD